MPAKAVDRFVGISVGLFAVLLGGVVPGSPAFGILVAAAVPVAFVTSLRTKAAVYFLLLPVVGWAAVHYPGLGFQGLPGTIALVMGAQLGWEWLAGRTALPLRHPLVLLAGLLSLVVMVQARNPIILRTGQSLSGLRTYLPPMLLLPVGLVLLRTAADARRFDAGQ